MAICFDENDIRPMGRDAVGVRGIKLRDGDYCIGAARGGEGKYVLSVTENGYGKRTIVSEYLKGGTDEGGAVVQKRGGMGLKNYNVTEKTGKVAAIKVVTDEDDVLLISDDGTIIRMAASEISIYGRATQGVRLMKVTGETKVISLARAEREEEESENSTENVEN